MGIGLIGGGRDEMMTPKAFKVEEHVRCNSEAGRVTNRMQREANLIAMVRRKLPDSRKDGVRITQS